MGQLKNAFNKAVLSTALTASLFAGMGSQSAFAQAGPPPGPSSSVTTVADIQQQSWRNDENYIRILNAYTRQQTARENQYHAQEKQQVRVENANYQIQEWNLEQARPNYMKTPQGTAQYWAAQVQYSAQHNARLVNIKAAWDSRDAQEDMGRNNFVAGLDARFSSLPEYKPGGAGPRRGPPPWANDPSYVQKKQLFEQQLGSQSTVDKANTDAQLRVLDANHMAQNVNIGSQLPQVGRFGLPGYGRVNSQMEIANATYDMNRTIYQQSLEQREGMRDQQYAEYMFNLDRQFGAMPQYKNAPTQKAPSPAPAPRAPGS
ncbi:MAG: hypothetical protein ACAH83_19565 [Alphaproteobacteria bacterium]